MTSLLLSTYQTQVEIALKEPRNQANYWIYQELKHKGEAYIESYDQLELIITENEIQGRVHQLALTDLNLIIPRSTTYSDFNLNYGHLAEILANFGHQHHIRVLNGQHFKNFSSDFNKLFQVTVLSQHHLPIPDTYFSTQPTQFITQEKSVIAKPLIGSKGQGIEVFTLDQLAQLQPNQSKQLLYQQILPNKSDYRVIVLGGNCLGAMKRTAGEGKVVSNFSAGGSVEKAELNQEMIQLATTAAQVFELEFCGVDLMLDQNNHYRIIEVNRFPDFIGFVKSTGVKVATQLVDYLENTLEQI